MDIHRNYFKRMVLARAGERARLLQAGPTSSGCKLGFLGSPQQPLTGEAVEGEREYVTIFYNWTLSFPPK